LTKPTTGVAYYMSIAAYTVLQCPHITGALPCALCPLRMGSKRSLLRLASSELAGEFESLRPFARLTIDSPGSYTVSIETWNLNDILDQQFVFEWPEICHRHSNACQWPAADQWLLSLQVHIRTISLIASIRSISDHSACDDTRTELLWDQRARD